MAATDVLGEDFDIVYFNGASFDGRDVYYVPGDGTLVVRYDTQGDFASAGAWTSVDLWLTGASAGFTGAAFDGECLYLAPRGLGPIMRFDAAPQAPPPGSGPSFY